MEIRLLRYFRAVVDTGALTKAASFLHITPGALSKAVRQLEDETGKELFSRAGRSLVLTEHGRTLYNASERLIEEHQSLLRSLDTSRPTSAPVLRVASFEPFTTHCLGAITEHLVERSGQDVALHVLELRVGDIERAVASGDADYGITYAPFPAQDVHHQRLARTEFGIFARRGAFAKTAFDALPFAVPVVPLDRTPANLLGIDSWPYEKVSRLVKYRLTSLESALELTRRGRCAVFIPLFIAKHQNGTVRREHQLTRRPNPSGMKPVHQRVYLVSRPDGRGTEAMKHLTAAVRTAVSE